jgi:hypothetical protein
MRARVRGVAGGQYRLHRAAAEAVGQVPGREGDMMDSVRVRMDCRWCGAKREVDAANPTEVAGAVRAWLELHKPCAKGEPSLVECTGQTAEDAPEMPIVKAVI